MFQVGRSKARIRRGVGDGQAGGQSEAKLKIR